MPPATGHRPFLVVGVAGSTDTGRIDQLDRLADIAERIGAWFHLDAAYGGFFALTKRGRERLLLGGRRRLRDSSAARSCWDGHRDILGHGSQRWWRWWVRTSAGASHRSRSEPYGRRSATLSNVSGFVICYHVRRENSWTTLNATNGARLTTATHESLSSTGGTSDATLISSSKLRTCGLISSKGPGWLVGPVEATRRPGRGGHRSRSRTWARDSLRTRWDTDDQVTLDHGAGTT